MHKCGRWRYLQIHSTVTKGFIPSGDRSVLKSTLIHFITRFGNFSNFCITFSAFVTYTLFGTFRFSKLVLSFQKFQRKSKGFEKTALKLNTTELKNVELIFYWTPRSSISDAQMPSGRHSKVLPKRTSDPGSSWRRVWLHWALVIL